MLAHATDGALLGQTESWHWLLLLLPLAGLAALLAWAWATGPEQPRRGVVSQAGRLGGRLGALLAVPGWVATAAVLTMGALVIAVIGFYWDVAWHIDFGRDEVLFTPPHTMIVVGLAGVLIAGLATIAVATAAHAEGTWRAGRLRVPRSALLLVALGAGALVGFPLDELWHAAYGVDVTMWSPTHLLMIAGASFATLALWLAFFEGGAERSQGFGRHLLAGHAGVVLVGISTFQGEFDFGVPQFQQLYHPVLVLVAAGVVLVAVRLVQGPGAALLAAAVFLVLRGAIAVIVGPLLGHTTPRFALYVPAALAVELAARWVGTDRLVRYAVAAGSGVATVGLAGEWVWALVTARQPWRAALLPDALLVGGAAALAASVLGAALGATLARRRTPHRALVSAAAVVVVVTLAVALPRTGGDVSATLDVTPLPGGHAGVSVVLDPPDAADRARWFQTIAWQGGGLVLAPMVNEGGGRFRAAHPVPVDGRWKALVRLHRGSELVAVPVALPEDREIDAPAVPLGDREVRFGRDTRLLLRESRSGPASSAVVAYTGTLAAALVWGMLVVLASAGLVPTGGRPPRRGPRRLRRAAVGTP